MALINRNFIDEVIYKSDIIQIVSEHIELKRAGPNYSGLSPFTNEKTPSLMVNVAKQSFNDYSSGQGGNVLKFIQLFKKCNFPEAVNILADRLNLHVKYDTDKYSQKQSAKLKAQKENRPVIEIALKLYKSELEKLGTGHPATLELKNNRRYNDLIVRDWDIGFAPGNKILFNHLQDKGLVKQGQNLGLLSENNDKYFNRVVYPIRDHLGNLVGLAGRTVAKNGKPKWINPMSSIVYQKNSILFGLHNAISAISKKKEVWIVEGYNDVIAFQENGIVNTVGICGTSLTPNQIQLLKRYCNKIILCMDGDAAGVNSLINKVPAIIQEGLQTEVIHLKDELDPDDFVRKYQKEILTKGLLELIKSKSTVNEGFDYLMNIKLKGSDFEKIENTRYLCKLIANITNESHTVVYTKNLVNKSEAPKKEIDKWIKEEYSAKEKNLENFASNQKYTLPKEVGEPSAKLEAIIDEYGIFMHSNKIYSSRNVNKPYFHCISNFEIEVIQHMIDEKNPMKLVRIKNTNGQEKVFDVLSEYLNTPQKFDNTITGHGNFLWDGTTADFQKLRKFLFDNMGTGQKIEVLGWQKEGFWVWNNYIKHKDGRSVAIDNNGVFKLDNICYYVPSANSVYRNNQFKYEPQKRFFLSIDKYSFLHFTSSVVKVHGNHGIIALMFSIASIFQDFIGEETGGFPILFMYGKPSTGKDNLTYCCQSFFGRPQVAINLESGASTIKGQMRTLAQFSNNICQLSEYKRNQHQNDGMLKGIWDRRGYTRGNLDSHVGTDTIPILSSVILTGNEYPTNDALITRLIWCEMNKEEFNDVERENYNKLNEVVKNGFSHLTNEFIKQRDLFTSQFKSKSKILKKDLNNILPEAHGRMLDNMSILLATYDIFKDIVPFPFDYHRLKEAIINSLNNQIRKLASTNKVTKFWDCFLSAMRGNIDSRIYHSREFKVDNDTIAIQATNCILKVQKEWFQLFNEQPPSKGVLMEELKKDEAFKGKGKLRLRRDNSKSTHVDSVFVFYLDKITIAEDIRIATETDIIYDLD
jgi:DNA primase